MVEGTKGALEGGEGGQRICRCCQGSTLEMLRVAVKTLAAICLYDLFRPYMHCACAAICRLLFGSDSATAQAQAQVWVLGPICLYAPFCSYMHSFAPICTVLLLYALSAPICTYPPPVCGHARTSQTPWIHGRLQRRQLEQVECIYRETNGAYRGTEAAYRTMAIWALRPDEAREMRTVAAQLCHECMASVWPLRWRAMCPEHTNDCSEQREQRVHIGTKGCI